MPIIGILNVVVEMLGLWNCLVDRSKDKHWQSVYIGNDVRRREKNVEFSSYTWTYVRTLSMFSFCWGCIWWQFEAGLPKNWQTTKEQWEGEGKDWSCVKLKLFERSEKQVFQMNQYGNPFWCQLV